MCTPDPLGESHDGFLTLLSPSVHQRLGAGLFEPFSGSQVEYFIIQPALIGWTSYTCFLCERSEAFLACCVLFFYHSLLPCQFRMPEARFFVQILLKNLPPFLLNIRFTAAFIDEFILIFFLLTNGLQWSQDTSLFYSKPKAFLLQHFLSFQPDLFRITSVGCGCCSPYCWFGLLPPPSSYWDRLCRPHLRLSSSGRPPTPGRPPKVPDPTLLLKRGLLISTFLQALYFI